MFQDESSSHDCNQRHVLLYGVNKLRDEARHTVKRISKDICKLFSKKFSIDVAEGRLGSDFKVYMSILSYHALS